METSKIKEGGVGLHYSMLSRSNYTAWALKMKVFMQAHGVWIAVEPKDPKAEIEEKVDKTALAVIYQGIPEDLLLSVADKATAKEAWEALKTMCLGAERVKKAKVQTLKAEFEALQMKDTELLDDFCMKINGLVTNIRALGEEIKEDYVVKKLLRAVPSKFLQIASTIEQFGNLESMTVEETVGSLKAHEERMKGQSEPVGGKLLLTEDEWMKRENSEGKLLLTREEWLKRSSLRNQNSGGDVSGRDGIRSGRDRSKIRCFNCHVYGHFAAECRKPKRGKEQQLEVNMSQTQSEGPSLLMTRCEEESFDIMLLNEDRVLAATSSEGNKGDTNIWYLDNGASNHMTG